MKEPNSGYFNNESKVIRVKKDKDHPYDLMPAYYSNTNKYDYIEQSILYHLSSNADGFIIVKSVVMKRLGIPKKKFIEAWEKLKLKGHLTGKQLQGGWEWTFNEKSNNDGEVEEGKITKGKPSL